MFQVLALVPRWLLLGVFLFLFGFALGHITAYRHLALEAVEARIERAHALELAGARPAAAATRPGSR